MAERRQRWVWWLLRLFGWLAARLATFAIMAVLVGSLFVVSLAFETTTMALSWAAQSVMGRSFVASVMADNTDLKKQTRQLEQEVGKLDGRNAELSREKDRLVDDNRRLANEAEEARGRSERLSNDNERLRAKNLELEADAARLSGETEDLSAKNRRLAGAVDDVSATNTRLASEARATIDVIDQRSAALGSLMLKTATRNVASIPLESVPIIGGVTIVFVTAMEISEACTMMNEMQELRAFAGLERQDSLMNDICSLVPTFPVQARYENGRECREHQRELDDFYGDTSPEVASEVGEICTCLEDVGIPDKEVCYPDKIATAPSP